MFDDVVAAVDWTAIGTWATVAISAAGLIAGARAFVSRKSTLRLRQRQRGGDRARNIQAGRDVTIREDPEPPNG